jgi:hypothetical protein
VALELLTRASNGSAASSSRLSKYWGPARVEGALPLLRRFGTMAAVPQTVDAGFAVTAMAAHEAREQLPVRYEVRRGPRNTSSIPSAVSSSIATCSRVPIHIGVGADAVPSGAPSSSTYASGSAMSIASPPASVPSAPARSLSNRLRRSRAQVRERDLLGLLGLERVAGREPGDDAVDEQPKLPGVLHVQATGDWEQLHRPGTRGGSRSRCCDVCPRRFVGRWRRGRSCGSLQAVGGLAAGCRRHRVASVPRHSRCAQP